MSQFLEALNSDEVDLECYNLFVLILGYNNLELDRYFFELYYKHILDSLQHQSPVAKFIVSSLVSDLKIFENSIHSKNTVIKCIKELSHRIYLFNLGEKFIMHSMVVPKFICNNKLTPTGAGLLIKFLEHKITGEVTLW